MNGRAGLDRGEDRPHLIKLTVSMMVLLPGLV